MHVHKVKNKRLAWFSGNCCKRSNSFGAKEPLGQFQIVHAVANPFQVNPDLAVVGNRDQSKVVRMREIESHFLNGSAWSG